MRTVLAALVLTTLVACGDPTAGGTAAKPTGRDTPADITTEPDPDLKVRGYGLVFQDGDKPVELCLGAVNDSLPPQCGGPRVEGWDWDAVPDEETMADHRWGNYEVTGYYDGSTFRVVDARKPPPFESESDQSIYETPCEEPPGGWRVEDPERATEADRGRAVRYAESQPEQVATWVDYLDEPTEYTDPKDMILNVAFTENVEHHEAEIRKLWDGPLCVIEKEGHTQAELSAIQNSNWEKDYGLEGTWSSLDVVQGHVELGVMFIEDETRRAIAERYGEGTVVIFPALKPVD
jgi:hypothetical protein